MTATIAAQVRTPVRVVTATARVLLGLVFTVFGLNGFLLFMPGDASAMSAGALKFAIALAETGYMNPLVSGIQVLVGVLLLANRFVPLALALLAPIVVGIFTFHLFLDPAGLLIPCAVAAAEIYLAWAHRDAFRPMLRAR
ncbi:hypothetical protein SAMN05421504_111159 [Amycolatopsis xylanica]|uniref:DoxX protein n=1 Tax=Amycolatopsis xylanica TaxID=589385 RepID=A0A1H3RKT4_9PSEU|nr:hypothetical protein [Amycolatopsis xylanica]SDZ26230.1 hypothetical protein SAMN05421504_111159 [Amycolatopsis xylanica]